MVNFQIFLFSNLNFNISEGIWHKNEIVDGKEIIVHIYDTYDKVNREILFKLILNQFSLLFYRNVKI